MKDGYDIISLKKAGFVLGTISGRKSIIVEKRAKELGVDFVYKGQIDKQTSFGDFKKKEAVTFKEIVYIEDNYPDQVLMK